MQGGGVYNMHLRNWDDVYKSTRSESNNLKFLRCKLYHFNNEMSTWYNADRLMIVLNAKQLLRLVKAETKFTLVMLSAAIIL